MRGPNTIDFWRGFALATIFINHVPGIIFEHYSFRHYSISDSAELFVFLAGVSLRLVVNMHAKEPLKTLVYRLSGRAIAIYFAQLVITFMAIAIIGAAAKLFDQPYILQWFNASAVFQDPVDAHIGLVLLRYQLGYFDILPLYVVLMSTAPMMAAIDRFAPYLLLPLSAAIYIAVLSTGFNLRTWPVEGTWFFDPFAWQFIFVLGFVLGGPKGFAGFSPRTKRILFWLAGAQVLVGAAVTLAEYAPAAASVPSPKLFFLFNKTFLSPARVIHALALACFFAGAFVHIARWAAPLARYFSMLGRNSLYVFCTGSLMSVTGQILRYVYHGSLAIDSTVALVGLTVMGVVAWLSEWRRRRADTHAARLASA